MRSQNTDTETVSKIVCILASSRRSFACSAEDRPPISCQSPWRLTYGHCYTWPSFPDIYNTLNTTDWGDPLQSFPVLIIAYTIARRASRLKPEVPNYAMWEQGQSLIRHIEKRLQKARTHQYSPSVILERMQIL